MSRFVCLFLGCLTTFYISSALPTRKSECIKRSKMWLTAATPKIIIAGAPASGKGTQCEIITKEFGVVHLSTGDILRNAVKQGTELGMKAKAFMDAGQLVPDELITGVIQDRLDQEDCKTQGWLLDGFPRTEGQADALSAASLVPDCFILLDVPEKVLVERVTGRRTDPVTGKIYHMTFSPPESEEVAGRLIQRSDDTAEKIVVRYREFQSHIDAVKANYADRSIWVDGTMSPKEVSQCVVSSIRSALADSASQPKIKSSSKKSENSPLKIIIAGAPASGKGTQCEIITKEFGVVHLSTGDILRNAVKQGTDLGMKAKAFMDAGQLVPDELITGVIQDRLDQEDCKTQGWLLDGFPRTEGQADALSAASLVPDCFILLDVPEKVLVERVTGRRTDPVTGKIYHMTFSPPESEEVAARLIQRSDDTAEKIVVRYREFQSHIDAVKANYADRSIWVDGTMSPKEVAYCITSALKNIQKKKKDDNDNDNDNTSTATSTTTKVNTSPVKTILGTAALIACDKGLANVFRSFGWTFPSSLAGMVSVFAALLGLHVTSPKKAEGIADFLSPALALLKVWLPVFFVPPLVVLPLKMSLIAGSEGPLGLLVTGGLLASLCAATIVLMILKFIGIQESDETSTMDSIKQYPSPRLPPAQLPLAIAMISLSLIKLKAYDMKILTRVFGMSSSIFGYVLGTKVPDSIKKAFAHPVLSCAAIIIVMMNLYAFATGIPLNIVLSMYFGSSAGAAAGAGDIISSMLGPAVISFGLQLFQYRDMLRRNIISMTAVTASSAAFGLYSSATLAGKVFSLTPSETALAPLTRCITTPLALAGSRLTGGDPSLTAFFVVMTGILGASFGERILTTLGVKSPVAVGMSMGASAHGLGAASVSYDPIKFAAALVSMTLTGLWTVCALSTTPVRRQLMKIATGI